jgi:uncharacterized protein
VIVVADTSPLNYLIQLESERLLPQLYRRILAPLWVIRELGHVDAPRLVREWANHIPDWLEVVEAPSTVHADLAHLDPGEREAIQLAHERHADLLLIDERKGRQAAHRRGLMTTGTLGVLLRAGELGLTDPVGMYKDLIRKTTFRTSAALETHFLEMVSVLAARSAASPHDMPAPERKLPD